MIIGFDFDNTIVDYSKVFFKIAIKKKFITKNIYKNKTAIKKYLFKKGEMKNWKILQSEVYGKEMAQAKPYKGFLKILKILLDKKNKINIISHKTLYPYCGKKINLHKSSRKWIAKNIKKQLRKKIKFYFEKTEKKKILRIKQTNCNIFIDDLESILKRLPLKTSKILFSPEKKTSIKETNFTVIRSWEELHKVLI